MFFKTKNTKYSDDFLNSYMYLFIYLFILILFHFFKHFIYNAMQKIQFIIFSYWCVVRTVRSWVFTDAIKFLWKSWVWRTFQVPWVCTSIPQKIFKPPRPPFESTNLNIRKYHLPWRNNTINSSEVIIESTYYNAKSSNL